MLTPADLAPYGDEYDRAAHRPANFKVKYAYHGLCYGFLRPQFDILTSRLGIQVIVQDTDAYSVSDESDLVTSSRLMFKDIRENATLRIWGGGSPPSDHPLAAPSPFNMSWNSVLRAVHDFYGHFLTGSPFDAAGEITAWCAHRRHMAHIASTTPHLYRDAVLALNTETIAQLASRLNNGVFPPQKATLTFIEGA